MQQKRSSSVLGHIWPEILLFIFSVLAFLGALLMPLFALADGLSKEERQLIQAYQTGQIVRIHILAASDTPQDQQIKLAVRDRVLERFGGMLAEAGAESPEDVCRLLEDALSDILRAAEECAREQGFTGEVNGELGILSLPEKRYGQVLLPAGQYRGLRITLGEGQGQNWWCILFPSLCMDLLCDDTATAAPALRWDSLRILRQWTLLPPE